MAKRARDPRKELMQLWNQGATELAGVMRDLVRHVAYRERGRSSNVLRQQDRVARAIGQMTALADVLGRRRVVLEAKAASRGSFATAIADVPAVATVPQIPFTEAIADILNRTPEIATTAEEMVDVYSKRHGFAMARSTSRVVTQRVQRAIGALIDSGEAVPTAKAVISRLGDFTRAYSETVYRTNLNTAYSAGRWAQARDPDIAVVMVAGMVSTSTDSDVRDDPRGENHLAANGFVAATDDPVWNRISPPFGFNCRCAFSLVSRFELERMGRFKNGRVIPTPFPRDFRPHPGFAQRRPDVGIYSQRASFDAQEFGLAWPASYAAEHH